MIKIKGRRIKKKKRRRKKIKGGRKNILIIFLKATSLTPQIK